MMTRTMSVLDTRLLGARIAATATAGAVFVLEGDLGAGKTEFVRGFVTRLDAGAAVRSPSFSILNIYPTSPIPVYHFDFYRLTNAAEFDHIGLEEYLSGDGICLIEWGTMFPEVLPDSYTLIKFRDIGGGAREIDIFPS